MHNSVQAAVAANLSHAVTDSVTEAGDKIVVTTTISLDKAALRPGSNESAASLLSQALAGQVGQNDAAVSRVARAIVEARVQIVPIGPKLFLGLVNGRTQARPLCIDDNLFIFVPRSNSLSGMAELVAQLLQRIPPGSPWSTPSVQDIVQDSLPNASVDMQEKRNGSAWDADRIAQALNTILPG